jgi:hypothetical protein
VISWNGGRDPRLQRRLDAAGRAYLLLCSWPLPLINYYSTKQLSFKYPQQAAYSAINITTNVDANKEIHQRHKTRRQLPGSPHFAPIFKE